MVALGIYRKKKQQAPSIGTQRKEVAFDPGLRRSKEGHSVVWAGTRVQSPTRSQLFEKCGMPRGDKKDGRREDDVKQGEGSKVGWADCD